MRITCLPYHSNSAIPTLRSPLRLSVLGMRFFLLLAALVLACSEPVKVAPKQKPPVKRPKVEKPLPKDDPAEVMRLNQKREDLQALIVMMKGVIERLKNKQDHAATLEKAMRRLQKRKDIKVILAKAAAEVDGADGPRYALKELAARIDHERKRLAPIEKLSDKDGKKTRLLKMQINEMHKSENQLATACIAAFRALALYHHSKRAVEIAEEPL